MNRPVRLVQRRLACLAVPSRFRIVRRLLEGPRCVTELARLVGLSQSCTTRHLQALRAAGLVAGAREGKRVVFRLRADDADAERLMRAALGEPAAAAGPRRPPTGDRGAIGRERRGARRAAGTRAAAARPARAGEGVAASGERGASAPAADPERRARPPAPAGAAAAGEAEDAARRPQGEGRATPSGTGAAPPPPDPTEAPSEESVEDHEADAPRRPGDDLEDYLL